MKCIRGMRDVLIKTFFFFFGNLKQVLECCFYGARDQALALLEAQFVFPSVLDLSPHTGNIMNSRHFCVIFFFSMRAILQVGMASFSMCDCNLDFHNSIQTTLITAINVVLFFYKLALEQ